MSGMGMRFSELCQSINFVIAGLVEQGIVAQAKLLEAETENMGSDKFGFHLF